MKAIEQTLDAVTGFLAWREQLVADGPDTSPEGYRKHLEFEEFEQKLGVVERIARYYDAAGDGGEVKVADEILMALGIEVP